MFDIAHNPFPTKFRWNKKLDPIMRSVFTAMSKAVSSAEDQISHRRWYVVVKMFPRWVLQASYSNADIKRKLRLFCDGNFARLMVESYFEQKVFVLLVVMQFRIRRYLGHMHRRR